MKKIFCGIGVLVGVLSIILAIVCFCQSVGSYEGSKSYGGDAYTGIQNASAQAANNIKNLAAVTRFSGGSILFVSGLFSIAFFGMKIAEDNDIKINTDFLKKIIPANAAQSENAPDQMPVAQPEPIQEENLETAQEKNTVSSQNEWKCPKCGKTNSNYIGTCGCGETKP